MNLFRLISIGVFLFISSQAFSGSIYCIGKIEDWDLTKTGYLYVDGTWNNALTSQRMCHIEGNFDGVSAKLCNYWIAAVMAASLSEKQVKLKYTDVASCDAVHLGEWGHTLKAPNYIRVY